MIYHHSNCSIYNSDDGIFFEDANTVNNHIYNCNVSSNEYGIYIYNDSADSVIENCSLYDNTVCGINLYDAINITIRNNTLSNNAIGIQIVPSTTDCLIYNNYLDNTVNANDGSSGNIWNTTKTLETNILGGPYIGGNYWDDYLPSSDDGDGLGDTPYTFTTGTDNHPLLTHYFYNYVADPDTGIEDVTTFNFNTSYINYRGVPNEIKVNISWKKWYSDNTITWLVGDNTTGANYTYSSTIEKPKVYGYKFSAYNGDYWIESVEEYIKVTGGPGHYESTIHISYYDSTTGLGLSPYLFKTYISEDTTFTEIDRVYYEEYFEHTGYNLYYKVTDFFNNIVYPVGSNYATFRVSSDHYYLDIPIDWYDFAIKNMNETIMHFSMQNSSRYYNVTLFPGDSYHLNVLPGDYSVVKKFYSAYNKTLLNTLYDNITIYDDDFYIATGYTSILYIYWYNTNQGLGLPERTLQIWIDGVRQHSNVYFTHINETHNITIKDYYNFTMYSGNHTMDANNVDLNFGLTFHSWLFGNKNDDYYMISLLKEGANRWWERGIVPYGEREFLIPSGNYTLRIYDKDYTMIYQADHQVVNSKVYVIHGANLSEVISGLSVIRGQLLELSDDLYEATMPELVRIVFNIPYIYSVFDKQGAVIGTKLVCPALFVTATTTNTSTINSSTVFYPLMPDSNNDNGTITVREDAMYFEGNSSAINWINVSYDSTVTNYSYIPSYIDLFGENVTVDCNTNVTVKRVTTYQQIKKFYWTKYTENNYYEATVGVNNPFTSVIIKKVYVYIEFANDTTPDYVTTRCYDVSNGVYLTKGENFDVSASGVHFYLTSIPANTTRRFTVSYYCQDVAVMSSDAVVVIDDYDMKTHENKNYWHVRGQYVNEGDDTFVGCVKFDFNFEMEDPIAQRSIDVYDNENSRWLDRDEFSSENGVTISQSTIGTVYPNGARTFDIYWLCDETEEEDGIAKEEVESFIKGDFVGMPVFFIFEGILGFVAVAFLSIGYEKKKSWQKYKKDIWISLFAMLFMFFIYIWYLNA
jgi:parallel beta-helix repeat protein